MRIRLDKAVDMAVRGIFPEGNTKVGKHIFRIRSLKNKNRLEKGETGYFRHVIRGKDNRVFFAIKVNGNGAHSAKITRIQYRGLFGGNGFTVFGVNVTDAAEQSGEPRAVVVAKLVKITKKIAKKIQKALVGKFEPQAAIIVDAIGRRMAA